MVDSSDSTPSESTPLEPVPPPGGPPPDSAGAGPAPRDGLSTGAKVAIGCGVVFLLGIVGLVGMCVVGGTLFKNRVDEFAGGMEAQQEASESLRELESDHPFSPPGDGVVGEERAERFFEATDETWNEMEPWVEEMEERGRRIDERGQAGVGDVMAGMRSVGEFGRARVALADALEDHDMPPSEYLWTGAALLHAYRSLDGSDGAAGRVPAENRALAERHRAELAEIADGGDGSGLSKGAVLAIAWTWGAGQDTYRDLGLDTLRGWQR